MEKLDCNCPKTICERHKKCDECREYHRTYKEKPLAFCDRPENRKD